MRPPKVAVVFDRKHIAPKKEGAFEIRVTYGGKSYYISTGVKAKRASSISLQESRRIASMQTNVTIRISDCLLAGRPIDMNDLRGVAFTGDTSTDFLDFFNERLDGRVMKEGTRKHYATTLSSLQEWGKMRSFASVTAENISAFDSWLHSKGLGDAGVYNYHKTLRAILSDAVLFDRISVNPYSRLKFSRGERQTIDYLTEEEFTKLRNVQLSSSMLEHARDLFVFQTYTALSYSDLCKFDIKSYRHEKGRYYKVDSKREKTGMKFVTVLLPPAVEIGEKYKWKLPIMCNGDYNRALKLVAAAAGISHSLHSHMARSTFATLAISHGARVQNVAKMLGHASVSMTLKRYGEILEHDVIEDFERLGREI